MAKIRAMAGRTLAAVALVAAAVGSTAAPAAAAGSVAAQSVVIDSPSGVFFSVTDPPHYECYELGKNLPDGETLHNNTKFVIYYYTYHDCYSDRDGEIAPGASLTAPIESFQVTDHT